MTVRFSWSIAAAFAVAFAVSGGGVFAQQAPQADAASDEDPAAAVTMSMEPSIKGVVPLPHPRPNGDSGVRIGPEPIIVAADLMTEPSKCVMSLQQTAVVEPIAILNNAAQCEGEDMVRLKAVIMPDKRQVPIVPAPEVRCKMATALVGWVRGDLDKALAPQALASIIGYSSYECRPRNRLFGAKVSEHGRGNALDIRAFVMGDHSVVDPTQITVAHGLRDKIRETACNLFSTVLGPGSDGFHEKHIHVDVAERHGNYRVCQWKVRDPPPQKAAAGTTPLPPVRPGAAGPAVPAEPAAAPDGERGND